MELVMRELHPAAIWQVTFPDPGGPQVMTSRGPWEAEPGTMSWRSSLWGRWVPQGWRVGAKTMGQGEIQRKAEL